MGAGTLIAVVSVLHVFVSHFAVGGGLWLVLTEMRANRNDDSETRAFVKRHSRFFMLLTLVFGAISGVGIWATIGLISPHGTSALIHGYLWGWAIEWIFFFVEIAAAIVYYYGWEKLDRRTHEIVGWVYFVAAWMSLFIINGIITFMLTSGGWLENQEFWTGFFNPTFWPSLFIRTFAGFAIAGMFTLMTAAALPRTDFRRRMTRWNAGWAVIGVIGVMASAVWYGRSVGVWTENEALLGAITVLPRVVWLFKLGLVVTLTLCLLPLVLPRLWNRGLAPVLLVAGLLTMGAGEWVRESGRKPFVIQGYMYSTGLLVSEEDRLAAEGVVAHTKWMSPASESDALRRGKDLFNAWCQGCHTKDGYNGLRPFLAHWNEETVASLVPRLGHMRALMPPWYGTEEENAALAAYLLSLKPVAPAEMPADRDAARAKSFAISCGLCHTPHGYRSLADSFEGMGADEIDEFLDEAGDVTDEMPGYFGSDEQRALLIEYLEALGNHPVEGSES
jgi:mono/diheme cytochrome c family protein